MTKARVIVVVMGVAAIFATSASTAAAATSRWVCIEANSGGKSQKRFVCQRRSDETGGQARQEPTITIEGDMTVSSAERQAEATESRSNGTTEGTGETEGTEAAGSETPDIEAVAGAGVGGVAEVILGILSLL